MSKLLDKIKANSTIKDTSILKDSKFFTGKSEVPTSVPIINAALSARIDGGLRSGLTTLAGPSKHFKSMLGLLLVSSYLEKYDDSVCLYYDSEYGSPPEYLAGMGIDTSRIIHTPVMNVEDLKFDMTNQLENIERGDHVIIFIDSIGNLASKKEVEDAKDQKSVADMTRAKALKSLWRICTPHFTTKDIPCVNINHTYQEIAMHPKAIVSGGTGGIYSSDTIFIIGKAKEREGTELSGHKFTINIEKSRFVREGVKFPFIVKYGSGIDKWSGLLDFALELGHVKRDGKRVVRPHLPDDKKWWAKDTGCSEFWDPILNDTDFKDRLYEKLSLSGNVLESDPLGEIDDEQLLLEDD